MITSQEYRKVLAVTRALLNKAIEKFDDSKDMKEVNEDILAVGKDLVKLGYLYQGQEES